MNGCSWFVWFASRNILSYGESRLLQLLLKSSRPSGLVRWPSGGSKFWLNLFTSVRPFFSSSACWLITDQKSMSSASTSSLFAASLPFVAHQSFSPESHRFTCGALSIGVLSTDTSSSHQARSPDLTCVIRMLLRSSFGALFNHQNFVLFRSLSSPLVVSLTRSLSLGTNVTSSTVVSSFSVIHHGVVSPESSWRTLFFIFEFSLVSLKSYDKYVRSSPPSELVQPVVSFVEKTFKFPFALMFVLLFVWSSALSIVLRSIASQILIVSGSSTKQFLFVDDENDFVADPNERIVNETFTSSDVCLFSFVRDGDIFSFVNFVVTSSVWSLNATPLLLLQSE